MSQVAGIKLQDVCQYEDKKKVKHRYFFDTRNENQPQGLRIDHWIV